MKCLITGAGGFIGGHLVEHLLAEGNVVYALCRRSSALLNTVLSVGAERVERLTIVEGDILDRDWVMRVVQDTRPEAIFHLAAQSLPNVSWQNPEPTFRVNVAGTLCLLDAAAQHAVKARIVLACSSAEYAPSPNGLPIREDSVLEPSSPYGVSKMAADHLARLYHRARGLHIVRARPFFLIGPRKAGDATSDFARGIVEIERGRKATLPVGNLEVVRDLIDVRDGVRALALLAERGIAGEVYNVCGGRGFSMRHVLTALKARAACAVPEEIDPGRMRTIDEPIKIGDPAKINALGFVPMRPFEETLYDILEYWRAQPVSTGS